MKNEKAIYKYKHDDTVGYMHYVVYDRSVVVLSKTDSKKVAFIKANGFLLITANIKANEFQKVECRIVDNPDYVERVYQYMIETNNAYFTEGAEELCAILFENH